MRVGAASHPTGSAALLIRLEISIMGIVKGEAPVESVATVMRLATWLGLELADAGWRRRKTPAGVARRTLVVGLAAEIGVSTASLSRILLLHKDAVIATRRRVGLRRAAVAVGSFYTGEKAGQVLDDDQVVKVLAFCTGERKTWPLRGLRAGAGRKR